MRIQYLRLMAPTAMRLVPLATRSFSSRTINVPLTIRSRTNDSAATAKALDQFLIESLRQGGNIGPFMNKSNIDLPRDTANDIFRSARQNGSDQDKQNCAWTLNNLSQYTRSPFFASAEARDTIVALYKSLGTDAASVDAKKQLATTIVNTANYSTNATIFCTKDVCDILVESGKSAMTNVNDASKFVSAIVEIGSGASDPSVIRTPEVQSMIKTAAKTAQEFARHDDITTTNWQGLSAKINAGITEYIIQHANSNSAARAALDTADIKETLIILANVANDETTRKNSCIRVADLVDAVQAITAGNKEHALFRTPAIEKMLTEYEKSKVAENTDFL